MTITRMNTQCDKLEKSNPGYNQKKRRTFYDPKTLKLIPNKELDCSIGCGWIAASAGYSIDLSDPFSTSNLASRFAKSGFFKRIPFKSLSQVKGGDFVIGPGHVVYARTKTKWWSAENDEKGNASGGKPGDQTGKEVYFRKPYMRSKGWKEILRLYTPEELLAQAINAYRTGKSPTEILKKLKVRAPWDGPRWEEYFRDWKYIDNGMSLAFKASTLDLDYHCFVVLGSGLTSAGKLTAKFKQRLNLAVEALKKNPKSSVIVTGGKPKASVTESAAGKAYLVQQGIAPERILIENKSSSTVSNARETVPILKSAGFKTYTLISHASHIRRATLLFLARRTQLETVDNKLIKLTPTIPLIIDDYTPKPVAPTLPISDASRREIGSEILALVG